MEKVLEILRVTSVYMDYGSTYTVNNVCTSKKNRCPGKKKTIVMIIFDHFF